METACYKIADRAFLLQSQYDYVHRFCAGYETEQPPAFTLTVTPEDTARERELWAKVSDVGQTAGDDYIEMIAAHRLLAERLLEDDILLFHGSAVALDGWTYLFTALSGTGKSTHARLWRERFGARVEMVNDDKPFLKFSEEGVTVFGSPWNGKHRLGENISRPLKAVCLLERDGTNHVEKIDKYAAYPILYRQSYRSRDPEKLVMTLKMLDWLGTRVPLYRLGCNMEPQAAEVACRGMAGEEAVL